MRAFFYTVSFIIFFICLAAGIAFIINDYASAGFLFFCAAASAGLGAIYVFKQPKGNKIEMSDAYLTDGTASYRLSMKEYDHFMLNPWPFGWTLCGKRKIITLEGEFSEEEKEIISPGYIDTKKFIESGGWDTSATKERPRFEFNHINKKELKKCPIK